MDAIDDAVPTGREVFVTAQGLLMYFEEADVKRLVRAIIGRFPGVTLMFDTIPPWFSKKTLRGFGTTKHYRAPPMPWGISRSDVGAELRRWSDDVVDVRAVPYGQMRGLGGAAMRWLRDAPVLRDIPPAIVEVRTRPRRREMR